jgi:hypothetical protein
MLRSFLRNFVEKLSQGLCSGLCARGAYKLHCYLHLKRIEQIECNLMSGAPARSLQQGEVASPRKRRKGMHSVRYLGAKMIGNWMQSRC